MFLLILGLSLWVVVHLFPSVMPDKRGQLNEKFGNAYQGVFALLIFSSIVFMVMGWKSMIPSMVYTPIEALLMPAKLLVFVGFILMVAANFPNTRIKKFIRHPQLTGVMCWAIAHLLANGDSRSVLLFSTLAIWSIVSMLMINKRDGEWKKIESTMPIAKEFMIPGIAVVMVAIFVSFHQYISGVALI